MENQGIPTEETVVAQAQISPDRDTVAPSGTSNFAPGFLDSARHLQRLNTQIDLRAARSRSYQSRNRAAPGASEAPMPVLGRTDYGGKSSSSGRDFVSAGGRPICGTAGMMITGNFRRWDEQHLVHSIDHRIWSERRLEIWRPRMERVVTPNSSSFDEIEAARACDSQVVSGPGGSPNTKGHSG